MSSLSASPWKMAGARDAERAEKREAVLRVAARAFCEKGVRATSLDEIAARLHVTKPTLYHYFANKDAILAACVLEGLRLIDAAVADAARQRLPALEQLRIALRRYAEIMTSDVGMCVTRISETELSPDGRKVFRAHKRRIDERIRGLVQDCIDEGSVRDAGAAIMTFTVAGALNWIARWYDPDGPQAPNDIADQVVDIVILGLAPREGPRNRT